MDALDHSGTFDPARQEVHLARYRFAASHVAGMRVADIACGTGYGSHTLRETGAQEVVGVDVSQEAIRYARRKYQTASVVFHIADATQTLLPDHSFDAIVSFETIEHVLAADRLLREFKRIIKPDGRLVISSPNDWGLTQHHCHTWSPLEFVSILSKHFTPVNVYWQSEPRHGGQCEILPWSNAYNPKRGNVLVLGRTMQCKT